MSDGKRRWTIDEGRWTRDEGRGKVNEISFISSKSNLWKKGGGILVTLITLAIIEIVAWAWIRIPNPPPILLLAVALSVFVGGLRQGLISAAITWLYTLYHFSIPGQLFHYTEESFLRIIVLTGVIPAMAILVGILKRKADRVAEVSKTSAILQAKLTEHQEAEEVLRESEQYNRLLFESSVIGLALCRMDGSLVDVNPAYAKIIGRAVDETLKLTYWDITPEKYAEEEQLQLESLKTKGCYGPYEKEYIHKDGHLVPVRLQGLIIKKEGEECIWSSVEDITERKCAEEALLTSEVRYRFLYEHVPVMNFTIDSSGKIISVNRFGANELGYTVEELAGKSVLDIFYEEDKPIVLKQVETCLQNLEKIYEWDLRKVHKNGQILWVHEVARVVKEKGHIEIHIACQNITERKRAEIERQESEQQLRLFVEHSPAAIAMFNRDMKYIIVSRRWLSDYGLGDQQIIGGATTMSFQTFPSVGKQSINAV